MSISQTFPDFKKKTRIIDIANRMCYNHREKEYGEQMKTKRFFISLSKNGIVCLLILCLLSAVVFDYSADTITVPVLIFLFGSVILTFSLAYFWSTKGKLTPERIALLITFLSFTVKLVYVICTGLTERQHDIGTFREGSASHSGYIYRLFTTSKLPESTTGQYYHPPLHYIIEALWLKLLTLFGVSFETAIHYVTVPTLFYSCAASYIGYKIFRELGFSPLVRNICCAVTAFHPTFIILSASYNNDILSIFLMLVALLYLIKWYKNPTFGSIMMIAFGIGFGMMAKLSAVYVAPAAAMIFLVKLIEDKRKLYLIGQYASFGALCIPTGLWWSVYTMTRFGLPFGYVMKLSETHDQYVGFRSVAERLFAIPHSFSEGLYFARGEKFGNTFHEYNIPSAVLKNSVFGEWRPGEASSYANLLSYVVFFLNVAIILFSLFCLVRMLTHKHKNADKGIKGILLIFYATMLVTFTKFCFDYQHDCTMDFRYIVPTVICGMAFIGMFLSEESESRIKKYVTVAASVICVLFCAASGALYIISA